MVLFCFKNVRFAKFIKRELKMNIEFSKTGSDKVWEKKVEGHVLLLVPARITHCSVSTSASHGTSHLTDVTMDIFNERMCFCCLSEGLFISLLPLERGRKLNGKIF